jgi:hypothetical protein
VKYLTYLPVEILRPYIKYFWSLEYRGEDNTPKSFSALADAMPGMMLAQSQKKAFLDEGNNKFPRIFIYGQVIEPVKMTTHADLNVVGICFHPNALKSVFGFYANELTGTYVNIDLVNNRKEYVYLICSDRANQSRSRSGQFRASLSSA